MHFTTELIASNGNWNEKIKQSIAITNDPIEAQQNKNGKKCNEEPKHT